jgi:LAO/AO transport system kinase
MNDSLLADFRARRPAALGRAVSLVENRAAGAVELLSSLHPETNRARRVGITGPPGAGKSTVATQLASLYRSRGLTVGVVAVDPTSPFTGGALLGDRVRMESVALDTGVFIRSMATRGSAGGLASATRDVCDVIDAFGFDRILIETVGVGQSELAITNVADSNVVLFVPESGDSIQTLKAGINEIGDVFAVNKCDRPGGEGLVRELKLMIELRGIGASGWTPAVLALVAKNGNGIPELGDALDNHFAWLQANGELRARRRQRLRTRVHDAVDERVRERVWASGRAGSVIDERLDALEAGQVSPLAIADAILGEASSRITTSH